MKHIKAKKSKALSASLTTTTSEPVHRGRAAGIFPIQSLDGEVEYGIQGVIGYDYATLLSQEYLVNWAKQRGISSGYLNETAFIRWALCNLAAQLGCTEHPVPAALQWYKNLTEAKNE